jgi:MoxR-like ATPase/Mg-chelatase subunit ChlD
MIGLRREAEVLTVTLAAGRHVILEGPPGTGKSTLLRLVADEVGWGVAFVEGNAELTPSRLVGTHDPALVLEGGYTAEAFVEGPLVSAMREGSILYVEELNRVPEETLNVLITALAEGEIHVPRVGHIPANSRFRLIAAMNPFDAVGTARVGQAIYDRMCRIAMTYQDEAAERLIVEQVTGVRDDPVGLAVAVTRATRTHPSLRTGSSVRGAIDMVLVARGLQDLRAEPVASPATLLDAALAALSGRVRVEDGREETAEQIISELLGRLLEEPDEGKAPSPPPDGSGGEPGHHPAPGGGQILEGQAARDAVREAGRRRASRSELSLRHSDLTAISPEVGGFDEEAFEEFLAENAEGAMALLSDLASATDAGLRARARRMAARVFLRLAREGKASRRGVRRLAYQVGVEGDLDLDRTLERAGGRRPRNADEFVVRRWGSSERAVCLLVDRSGSMSGEAVAMAALAAASVVLAAGDGADCSVIAFARNPIVLQSQGQPRRAEELVDDVLSLRGRGTTDLALALRAGAEQLARARCPERVAVLMSDCLATAGDDPFDALGGIDVLHVLGTSGEPESLAAGLALARRTRGRHAVASSPTALPATVSSLLG